MRKPVLSRRPILLITLSGLLGLPAAHGLEALVPLVAPEVDNKIINLGQRLFSDPRLSRDGQFSCSSCHHPDKGYADGLAFSTDANGDAIAVNTPGVSYSSVNFYQTWTGKLPSLASQLNGVITNPRVMNMTWPELVARLQQTPGYPEYFQQAGYQEISQASITAAIVGFQTSLSVPSRFDAFLAGDKHDLTEQELRGYQKFKNFGCISCHQGKNIGGNMRQKFGVVRDYFSTEGEGKKRDLGFFNTSGNEKDKYFFRVPSLRDVAKTAPYFHDASATTLKEAINVMFKHQLGIDANPHDIEDIRVFLHTLSSDH